MPCWSVQHRMSICHTSKNRTNPTFLLQCIRSRMLEPMSFPRSLHLVCVLDKYIYLHNDPQWISKSSTPSKPFSIYKVCTCTCYFFYFLFLHVVPQSSTGSRKFKSRTVIPIKTHDQTGNMGFSGTKIGAMQSVVG